MLDSFHRDSSQQGVFGWILTCAVMSGVCDKVGQPSGCWRGGVDREAGHCERGRGQEACIGVHCICTCTTNQESMVDQL
jgi:hypothetical protein